MPTAKRRVLAYGLLTLINLLLAMTPSYIALIPFINLGMAIYGTTLIVRMVRYEQRYDELIEQQ